MSFLDTLGAKILWLFSFSTLKSIVGIAFALGIVVIVHEWGHFITCRLLGIKVEEFSIGFGKLLKQFTDKKGTLWSLRAIPLGGYVKPAGEYYAREAEIKSPDEFAAKPWWARSIMVFAGAGMNYVLAFVIFFIIILSVGLPVTNPKKIPSVIGEVVEGYPAQKAGIKVDDKVVFIEGNKIENWQDLMDNLNKVEKPNVVITYEREGENYNITLPFSKDKKLGIMVKAIYEKVSPIKTIGIAAHQCYYWTALSLTTIWDKIVKREAPDVAGPIGIFEIVGKSTHRGWEDYFYLIGLISVAIGMFNLFPIPILDGGHIVFFLIEGITKKRPTEKALNRAGAVGATILILLVLYATYKDISRIKTNYFTPKKVAEETIKTDTENQNMLENKDNTQIENKTIEQAQEGNK